MPRGGHRHRRRRALTVTDEVYSNKLLIKFKDLIGNNFGAPQLLHCLDETPIRSDIFLPSLVISVGGFPAAVCYVLHQIFKLAYFHTITWVDGRCLSVMIECGARIKEQIDHRVVNGELKLNIQEKLNTLHHNTRNRRIRQTFPLNHTVDSVSLSREDWNIVTEPTEENAYPELIGRNRHASFSVGHVEEIHFHSNQPAFNVANVQETANKFKTSLKNHFTQVQNQQRSPIGHRLVNRYVKIKVSPEPCCLSRGGRLSSREEMMRLQEHADQNVEVEDFFTVAKRNAEKAAESLDNEAKLMFVSTHGGSVMLIGQAGIGKSTLACRSANAISNAQYRYIVFIKLAQVPSSKVTLVDFIINNASDNSTVFNKQEKSVMTRILTKDASQFLFIFDGIDELTFDLKPKEQPQNVQISNPTNPANIIKCLMNGELLREAKKLWTSRTPHAFELSSDFRPLTIMQVLGLDLESQDILGKDVCGDEKWATVKTFLESHQDIHAMGYVPVWCIMINFVLSSSVTSEVDRLPTINTITQILTKTFDMYIRSSHIRQADYFNTLQLAKLAWEAWIEKKIIFHPQDFGNIFANVKAAFFNTTLKSGSNIQLNLLQGDKESSFSHLVWHEFFAALYMCTLPLEEFRQNLDKLKDKHFEMVSQLVYGIFNAENHAVLCLIFPDTFNENEQKCEELKRFAANQMWQEDFKEQHLRVFSWIRESNNPEMLSCIYEVLPESLDFSTSPDYGLMVHPIDMINFSQILSNKSFQSISAKYVTFVGNSFDLFAKALNHTTNIKVLDLSGVDMRNGETQSLAQCLSKIDKLDLVGCCIRRQGAIHLTNAIKDLPTQLKRLDLSGNRIGNSGVQKLVACIHKVKSLYLEQCDITSNGIKDLSEKIKTLSQPMNELYLKSNDLGNTSNCLIACLPKVRELHLNQCIMPEAEHRRFTTQLTTQMKMKIYGLDQMQLR